MVTILLDRYLMYMEGFLGSLDRKGGVWDLEHGGLVF